jgi:N utilization substance protein A
MKSEFLLAFNQICSDRGLSSEVVLEALQTALVSTYQRNVSGSMDQNVVANIDPETGQAHIFVEKQAVEKVTDPEREISLAEARAIKSNVAVGEGVMVENTPKDFGRIAAQNAKQIILQRIREAEREARYTHYVQQEGEIIHGTVQSIKPQAVTLHIEGTEAILPRRQQVPGERYTLHQRLRTYVLEVRKTGRGPQITVSRSHKNMLRRLLELEVPEIFNGAVDIKSIAREAGSRSKVAVAALQPGVDPVGACVGMRGVRIQSIVNELGGEKIDVIEWSPETAVYIAKSLSPAKVLSVQLEEDPVEKTANVVVPDDQLSLAIGRAGQNARLAAKLTGWRIDIQGVTEAATWALQQVNVDPRVLPALGLVAESLPTVASTLRQHEQEKLPYTGEELLAMRQVIEGVRSYYTSLRHAERARQAAEEAARRSAIETAATERRTTIAAARARIPARAYEISLTEIGLSPRSLAHLERAGVATVGKVLERLAEGDEGLLKLEGVGPKSLTEIKQCIEALGLPEVEETVPVEEEAAAKAVSLAEPGAQVPAGPEEMPAEELLAAEEVPVATAEEAVAVPAVVLETIEKVPAEEATAAEEVPITTIREEAAATPEVAPEPVGEAPGEEVEAEQVPGVAEVPELLIEEEEDLEELGSKPKKGAKQDRRLRQKRQLVYNEELGVVIARSRHKRDGGPGEWDEFSE